jgi:hypothetical protein
VKMTNTGHFAHYNRAENKTPMQSVVLLGEMQAPLIAMVYSGSAFGSDLADDRPAMQYSQGGSSDQPFHHCACDCKQDVRQHEVK